MVKLTNSKNTIKYRLFIDVHRYEMSEFGICENSKALISKHCELTLEEVAKVLDFLVTNRIGVEK